MDNDRIDEILLPFAASYIDAKFRCKIDLEMLLYVLVFLQVVLEPFDCEDQEVREFRNHVPFYRLVLNFILWFVLYFVLMCFLDLHSSLLRILAHLA